MTLQQRLDAAIDSALTRNTIVGTVLLVRKDGEEVYARAAGLMDREANVPMRRDAIFLLASVTKPIVATTALVMIDKGLLGLDDAVADHLPYFRPRLADGREPRITIRQLLTHTAGLAYGFPADPSISSGLADTDLSFEENFSRIAAIPLSYEPGTSWFYSIAIDVLGAVLAQVHGGSLGDAAKTHVADPLGMGETGFFVADRARLAKPYGEGDPVPVAMGADHVVIDKQGLPTRFAPGRIFNPKAFQSGGAGMAGTADDIIKLLEMLRKGGDGLLKPETARAALSNQIGSIQRDVPGHKFGFVGGVVVDPAAAASPVCAGTVTWGGVYGHNWFIDPTQGLTVLSMSNTALEGCLGPYREEIRDAVYG